MLHQDKKRWKQVKHHWFDIIQPIRPHLRWKFFTISCKNVTILFSMWQEKLKIFMEWTVFFLHCHPIPYFIIHVCSQKINKHSEMTKSWNFQTSPYQRLKSNFRVFSSHTNFLALMCYTKIRKDENKLSIIDLTSYSQSDHILGENSLQSVVKMSQSYFLCDRKSWKFSWNELFFPSLPSYFLFHNTCLQSKNW